MPETNPFAGILELLQGDGLFGANSPFAGLLSGNALAGIKSRGPGGTGGFGLGQRYIPQATPATPDRGRRAPDRGNVPTYGNLQDFINSMMYGIRTGDFGMQQTPMPGFGGVGRYAGPSANDARTAARLGLGTFSPVNRAMARSGPSHDRSGGMRGGPRSGSGTGAPGGRRGSGDRGR